MDKRFLPANANRFEVEQDGQVGYLMYEIDGQGWITLWHTEVPQALRGEGLGDKLLRMAFDYTEANHLTAETNLSFCYQLCCQGSRGSTRRRQAECNGDVGRVN